MKGPKPFRSKLAFIVLGLLLLNGSAEPGPAITEKFWTQKDSFPDPAQIIIDGGLFRRLAAELRPTVVRIQSLQKVTRFYGDFHLGMPGVPPPGLFDQLQQQGEGSGFIISKDGYILTMAHVVAESDEVQVALYDGKLFKGQVIGLDRVTDLALIKIDAPLELPVLPLGRSGDLKPGDWVMAIGNPFGLDLTVTVGIVSAKGRSLGKSPYDEYIQIDAPINPGNSGGPLINIHGEVVGINAAIIVEGQGLGFSVPIDLAKTLLPQLKEKGRVVRSWLGVVVQDITLSAKETLGIETDQGSLVRDIKIGSPAEKSGIRLNDVILEINGRPIKSAHEFPRLIAHLPAGVPISIKLVREGKILELEAVLEEVPEFGFR